MCKFKEMCYMLHQKVIDYIMHCALLIIPNSAHKQNIILTVWNRSKQQSQPLVICWESSNLV